MIFEIEAWSTDRDSIVSGTVLMTIPESPHLLDCTRVKIAQKETVVVKIICRFSVAKVRLEVPMSDFCGYVRCSFLIPSQWDS